MAGIYVFAANALAQTSYQFTVKAAAGQSFTLNSVLVSTSAVAQVELLDAGTTPTGASVLATTFQPIATASSPQIPLATTRGYAASDMTSGISKFKNTLVAGFGDQLLGADLRGKKYQEGQQFTIKVTSAATDVYININITENPR